MGEFKTRAQAPKHLDLYGVIWIAGVVALFYYHVAALAWLLLIAGPVWFAVRNYRINKPYMDAEKAQTQAAAAEAQDLKRWKKKYDSECLDVKWAAYRKEISTEEAFEKIAAIGDKYNIPDSKRVHDLTIYAARTDASGRVTMVDWATIDPERNKR
jgi:hypothetical protein